MKKIVIVVPKINPLKETKEERKCRVKQAGSSMRSRVVPNKKKIDKKKQRQNDKKIVSKYI